MKAAKPGSQIKRFVHLFGGHAPENTPAFFFRHALTIMQVLVGVPLAAFSTIARLFTIIVGILGVELTNVR
jgi:hypothetical protein